MMRKTNTRDLRILILLVLLRAAPGAFGAASEEVHCRPRVGAIPVGGGSALNTRKDLAGILEGLDIECLKRGVVAIGEKVSKDDDEQISGPSAGNIVGVGGDFIRIHGSGFVVQNGPDALIIITNNHVVKRFAIDKSGKVEYGLLWVVFGGDELVPALGTVSGVDPKSDIAVIRVDLRQWNERHGGPMQEARMRQVPVLDLGDSDALKVGQRVFALGHPYAKNSVFMTYLFTTKLGLFLDSIPVTSVDGHLNPGNSGGPLLDLSGKVVGVNRAIFPESQGYVVPINPVRDIILPQLMDAENPNAAEKMRYGTLGGIALQAMNSALMRFYGLATSDGGLVAGVPEGIPSLADGSGPKRGDVIVGVGGRSPLSLAGIQSMTLTAPWNLKNPDSPDNAVIYDVIPVETINQGRASEPGSVKQIPLIPQHKTLRDIRSSDKVSECEAPPLPSTSGMHAWGLFLEQAAQGVWVVRDDGRSGLPEYTFLRQVAYHLPDGKVDYESIEQLDDVSRLLEAGHSEIVLVFSCDWTYTPHSRVTFFPKHLPNVSTDGPVLADK